MKTSIRRRNTGRITGLGLILSTPITAFVSFAFFASIMDENRLEESLLGPAVMLLPAAMGLAILIWAQCWLPLPNATVVALIVGLVGIGVATVGVSGILQSRGTNDANIGAPLLILGGIAIMATAGGIVAFDHMSRNRAASLPPPPMAPNPPEPT